MYNFVYCFDKNYLKQAFVSLGSILQNVNEPIVVHLISNIAKENLIIPDKILNHRFLKKVESYKISMPQLNIYNLKNVHVTEATFYRLFIENYLKSVDEYFIYLDCDIICLKDPIQSITAVIAEMKNQKKSVAFNTEILKSDDDWYFHNLNLSGDKYFNAGVMIFNVDTWNNSLILNKSLKLISILKEKAKFWDQDILNVIFDGEFYELPNQLNSRVRDDEVENVVFHHFSGKYKPWTIHGFNQKYSKEFHDVYKYFYNQSYLIEVNNISNAFNQYLFNIKSSKKKYFTKDLKLNLYFLKAILKKTIKKLVFKNE